MLKLTSNDSRRLQTGNQASIRHQKSNPATPSTTVPLSRPPLLKYTPIGLLKCLSLEKNPPQGKIINRRVDAPGCSTVPRISRPLAILEVRDETTALPKQALER